MSGVVVIVRKYKAKGASVKKIWGYSMMSRKNLIHCGVVILVNIFFLLSK